MADESRFSLRGRVALVTGSTSGLGQAMAHALGAAGASVALNYANHTTRAEQTFKQYLATGYQGKLFRGNVIDPAGVRKLVGEITTELGPIDILVLKEQKDAYLATVPAGRWGIPDDLAGLVTLLAGESASFISGQNICVNGGLTVS